MTKETPKLASRKRLPPLNPPRFSKTYASKLTGGGVRELLGVDKNTWKSWGNTIPPPYSGRLKLSDWGKKKVTPRFVSLEDALIIFKDEKFLSKFFGQKEHKRFLTEIQSYYMLDNFGVFMTEFTLEELKAKYYL